MKKVQLGLFSILTLSLIIGLTGCSLFQTNQSPAADFSATPKSGETPLEVSFDASASSDSDGEIVTYDWDFGDGSTASGVTVDHTYTSADEYTVKLTVIDDDGATNSATVNISVSPTTNQSPTARFTTDSTSGPAPFHVNFEAFGSSDPDGTIESYEWDLGDGSTSSGVTLTHTYSDPGNYSVRLTVTDNNGATGSATKTLPLPPSNQPVASFTASPSTGRAPLEVSFDASASSDSDGEIVTYDWDFGDGSTASGVTVDHTYTSSDDYTVELMVVDNDGATDTATETISVAPEQNEPPNAVFVATTGDQTAQSDKEENILGTAPLEVQFDASKSSDPDGAIESYSWDFDDGESASGIEATHTFNQSAESTEAYTVVLTVTDNGGAQSITEMTITAEVIEPPPPPG